MTLPGVTVTDADNYFATTSRDAAWQAVADKQIQLNEAASWLGQLCYDTTRECCGNSFAFSYTRAVSELALALSLNPTAVISGGGGGSAAIKRAQLGGLSVEYFEAGTGDQAISSSAPAVLRAFPWLTDILGCWLNVMTGSARVLHRSCY